MRSTFRSFYDNLTPDFISGNHCIMVDLLMENEWDMNLTGMFLRSLTFGPNLWYVSSHRTQWFISVYVQLRPMWAGVG